jgi:pimeloyl-ACP methyl ester carboxylesterase
VQVALELAHRYPGRVTKLILLNGTHGHALSTGFQPLFRIPWLSKYIHEFIDIVKGRRFIQDLARPMLTFKPAIGLFGKVYGKLRGNPRIGDFAIQYMTDVFGGDFRNYLRLFQELDAHSVYHHLRDVDHPALIVSGLMDYLTPAYQSQEIARKMPNSKHLRLPLASHFALLEYPRRVVDAIEAFIYERA